MSLRAASLLLLATALAGPAQVSSIATNDDGSVILFSSPVRLAETKDNAFSKIFRWDGQFSVVFSPPDSTYPSGGAYGAVLGGDGSVYGYSYSYGCIGSCTMNWPQVTYIRNGVATGTSGTMGLSRNGRFATGSPTWQGPFVHHRIDLETGKSDRLTDREAVYGITDSGRVLLRGAQGLRLAAPESPDIVVTNSPDVAGAAVSADGSRVLYSVRRGDLLELRMEQEILAVCQGPRDICAGYYPQLSNDGRRALIRESTGPEGAWAWWMDLTTGIRTELGPLGSFAAALSGDGRVAWLFDRNRQLVKVALDTGERVAIGEPFPLVTTPDLSNAVRGSRYRVYGAGFGNDPGALRLTLGNPFGIVEWPALEARETHFDFQLPWSPEPPLPSGSLAIGKRGHTFEQVVPVRVEPRSQPSFWTEPAAPGSANYRLIIAAHGDYRGRVTPEDPARPGEVVHVYMAGLGPVSPPQQDFTPAPSDPPARVVTPPACAYGGVPARTEFAGLAPGMIGVYLVSLEIPRDWSGPPNLFCPVDDGAGRRSTTGYLPVRKQQR